jgi:hypothetical protein
VNVRLFPLWNEHWLPMLVDVVFFVVVLGMWTFTLGDPYGTSAFAVIVLTVAFHFVQMRWLVYDRFDDDGVTIVRTWRRRHIPWTEISGLVYTQRPTSNWGRDPYQLRLVLRDAEPPLGRYMSQAEWGRYATGPVLMTIFDPQEDLYWGDDNRQVQCANKVFAELARRGFPKPPPYANSFRLARFTDDELTRASAIDMLRLHPVTVTHGALDASGTELLEKLLALASDAGPTREIHREPDHTIFEFETPDAAESFRAAARLISPAAWPVTADALPARSAAK